LRKVINSIYRFFIGRVRRRRDELKETGKRELVEHLKAIDFAKTQRLLVQYKARFSDKPEQPSTPVQRKPPQPQAPKTAPPKPSAPPLAESVAPVQPLRTPQAAIRPVHQPQPAPEPPRSPYMPPVPRPASTGPIVQRASVQQQQQQQQQQPGSAPPASFLDRTVAWLVGEGAEQESSAPLLCRRCQAPQRLIPQGEIVEFVCAKCGFLNRDRDEPAEQAEQRANDDVDDSASDATWAASSDDADPDDDNDAAKPVASDEEDQITKED
jgi:hypothetical protein